MNKYGILKRIKKLYENNINIINYLNEMDKKTINSIEDIMISYDFQAGSYIEGDKKNPEIRNYFCETLISIIKKLENNPKNIFEPGAGEGNNLKRLLESKCFDLNFIGGCDLSWSRMKYAEEFLGEKENLNLFMGNMFNLPLKDNSIDIVYTSHAMEPNGGKEAFLLRELYRITNKYLILFEPIYELASREAKERMDKHGYVKDLYKIAKNLGYNVLEYKLMEDITVNPLNPTGLIIISKNYSDTNINLRNPLCCPITKTNIEKIGNMLFSEEAMLSYPILNNIPCLLDDYAIITTKLKNFY